MYHRPVLGTTISPGFLCLTILSFYITCKSLRKIKPNKLTQITALIIPPRTRSTTGTWGSGSSSSREQWLFGSEREHDHDDETPQNIKDISVINKDKPMFRPFKGPVTLRCDCGLLCGYGHGHISSLWWNRTNSELVQLTIIVLPALYPQVCPCVHIMRQRRIWKSGWIMDQKYIVIYPSTKRKISVYRKKVAQIEQKQSSYITKKITKSENGGL